MPEKLKPLTKFIADVTYVYLFETYVNESLRTNAYIY